MRIQYASDLHLEFRENEDYFYTHPFEVHGDILVLAGDVVPFDKVFCARAFFDHVSKSFQKVYWLPGNHEYYHSDITERNSSFCEEVFENVFLVNNICIQEGDCDLIFSTMWTHIGPVHAYAIQRGMSDFKVIKYDGQTFSPQIANQLHMGSVAFIEDELLNITGRTKIVVTHHVPTFLHYPKQFLGDALNEGFAVELDKLMLRWGPGYWIFGHHHSNVAEFSIGNTKLLTNQLGYLRYGEQTGYRTDAFIEV